MTRAAAVYVAFLAGGIASGKSSAARELERLGARRIDLDAISREVLAAGTPLTRAIAEEFGTDLLDVTTGELDRGLLAARAFATAETTQRLEAIEIPAIIGELHEILATARSDDAGICVVEVALLDRLDAATLALADEIISVTCPLALRRVRAQQRGMSAQDFDARSARQPSDAWLTAHADTVWDNTGTLDMFLSAIQMWWYSRGGERYRPANVAELRKESCYDAEHQIF